MFRIGPFSHADALRICQNLKPEEMREWRATRGEAEVSTFARELIPFAKRIAIAYSDGVPVAMMGAIPLRPGVWNAFMVATPGISEVGLPFTRWARRNFFAALRTLGAHRVEAHVIADYYETHRWIKAIGAKVEAHVPRFGAQGEDFIRFVYLWDE